jgi:signal transduction histidine kinase/pimeloyl-ACP methyl ester carboxylesterase
VLVQGMGFDRAGWQPVLGPLGRRFRLVLMDNRGTGASDRPAGGFTVADLARDVIAVLDAARIGRVHVLGASLGGMVAQELAITEPDRVDGLVLACTAPGWPFAYPMPAATMRLIATSADLTGGAAVRRHTENALSADAAAQRPELVDRLVNLQAARPVDTAVRSAQARAGARYTGRLRQGRIRARTLIVHGDADRVVDPRNARLLAERIPGARLVLFPGLGHLLFWEDPDGFARAVADFLLGPFGRGRVSRTGGTHHRPFGINDDDVRASRRYGGQLSWRCIIGGRDLLVEPGTGLLPQLQLDELLAELQGRLQAVLATRDRMRGLLEAVVAIGSGLDLESTLRRIVETAVGLVDASYGALGVIGEDKRLAEFIPVGLSQEEIARIHHWPEGRGLLGLLIDDPRPLRLPDMAGHPSSSGFPDGHPPMRGFVGVPVRVRDEVFGNLYLTNKRSGGDFTEDDEAVLVALGAAAGVAVENARLYDAARRQQRWIQASAEVTTRLLSGSPPAEVLADITRKALELSGADQALLALPDEDRRRLTVAYAEGDGADAVRGLVLPAGQSLSGQVLASGEPVASADFAADERASTAARGAMSQIGPAIVFPLGAPGNVRGVLTVGRLHGATPFSAALADVVAAFAAQAGVALELAASRAEAERVSLYEDRDRIARDLHDLVIQRLYATGMSLEGTMPMITRPEVAIRITNAVDAMDETIKEIRTAIFALQSRTTAAGPDLRGQVVELVEEMTPLLGFAPSLRLGAGLGGAIEREAAEQALAALREALSNAARHAAATAVEVTVDIGADGLSVQVTDNGTGIPGDGRRSGLRNLATRAEKLGGGLALSPADPGASPPGTRLEWRVPLR